MGLWRQVGFTTRWLARPVDKTAARIPPFAPRARHFANLNRKQLQSAGAITCHARESGHPARL
jgi:hypothetical protein